MTFHARLLMLVVGALLVFAHQTAANESNLPDTPELWTAQMVADPVGGGSGSGTCTAFVDGGWEEVAVWCRFAGNAALARLEFVNGGTLKKGEPLGTQAPVATQEGLDTSNQYEFTIDPVGGSLLNPLLDCELWVVAINAAGTREMVGQFMLAEDALFTTVQLAQIHGTPQESPLTGECTIVTSREEMVVGYDCNHNQPDTSTCHGHDENRAFLVFDCTSGANSERNTAFGLIRAGENQIRSVEERLLYMDLDSGDPFNATTTIGGAPDPCQSTSNQICFGPRFRLTITPKSGATLFRAEREDLLVGRSWYVVSETSKVVIAYKVECNPLSGQLSVSLTIMTTGPDTLALATYEFDVTVTDVVDNVVSKTYTIDGSIDFIKDPAALPCSPF